MRERQAAILVSSAVHALLLVALALLGPPGRAPERSADTLVRLRLPPPETVARLPSAAVPAEGRAAGSATEPVARARPEAAGLSPPARSSRPQESLPPAASAAAAPEWPSVAELDAAIPRAAKERSLGSFAGDRMPVAESPRASASPAARLEPAPLVPLERPPAPGGAARAASHTGIAAPAVLPEPGELVSELRQAASRGSAAAEGTVEPVVSAGSRSLVRQPAFSFPAALRAEGREADVSIRIRIRPDGSVISAGVARSSGDPSVDSAAERVVRGYLFSASSGDTIDEGTVTFHFRLERGF